MKKQSIVGIAVLTIFGLAHECFATETKFIDAKASIITKLSTSQMVDIEISKSALDKSSPYASSFRWGGDKIFHPKYFISSFDVSVDSNKISISLSAYADLGNPSKVSFTETKNGFDLTIMGGDAGVGYRSIYTFEKSDGQIVLHSRKVMLLEFPGQAWEETVYSYTATTN